MDTHITDPAQEAQSTPLLFEEESQKLTAAAQLIGDELISLSTAFDGELQKWSDSSDLPNGLSHEECVGFINKVPSDSGINFVLDIQAPSNDTSATLRLWAIRKDRTTDDVHSFNNIQLTFAVDANRAKVVASKGADVTRDDLRAVLHDASSLLAEVAVSNGSGIDPASQQPVGDRFDATVAHDVHAYTAQKGIASDDGMARILSAQQVHNALSAVMSTLKSS